MKLATKVMIRCSVS